MFDLGLKNKIKSFQMNDSNMFIIYFFITKGSVEIFA